MKKIKLTKNEIKKQKDHLKRYHRYLPTLYIKKRQLQFEVGRINNELESLANKIKGDQQKLEPWIALFNVDVGMETLVQMDELRLEYDNVAGVDVPVASKINLTVQDYDLFETPMWIDEGTEMLRKMVLLQMEQLVLEEQKNRLHKELRITSQRVNLFEKLKIPEAEEAIRKISIYLGDLQTSAVGWSRMAKKKIQS